jgi:hypothetical protein
VQQHTDDSLEDRHAEVSSAQLSQLIVGNSSVRDSPDIVHRISSAQPTVLQPNTVQTTSNSSNDDIDEQVHRRSAWAACVPHVVTTLLALASGLFIASVARNFDSQRTRDWLVVAGKSLLIQTVLMEPLLIVATSPISMKCKAYKHRKEQQREKSRRDRLKLKAATVAIAFMNPVSHFATVRRNITQVQKKRIVIKAVSALQKRRWFTHTFLSPRSVRKLGLTFKSLPSDGPPIVCIAAIAPGTEAAVVPEIAVGLILTAVGETHVEGMELADILQKIRATQRSPEGELQLSFRRARTVTTHGTDEPFTEVRTPAQSEQDANGHPIESDGANFTINVSDSEDPDETASLFLQQEQEGRDKQQSQEAQPVTVSVSDQRGVDVTVDSCVHQQVEAKAAVSDTQTLANHTVDVSDVSEDPDTIVGLFLQQELGRSRSHRDDAMSVTAPASDKSDIDATVDNCVNQDDGVKAVATDEQALADGKVVSDEEDFATDEQMLALYDADPVKIDSATLSASDESDIDVSVDSFVNKESRDEGDEAKVIVCRV